MKTMNAVNAVQLFILVWTFTAVCQADDDFSVSCEDVTGTVSKEVTLNCSVSLKKSECCVTVFKFYYTKNNTNSEICREEFPLKPCEQRNSFTCSFSSTTVMTEQFRFFLQAVCGWEVTQFSVNITEPRKGGIPGARTGDNHGLGYLRWNTFIAVVVGCFIIIIIIIMTIIYKTKLHYRKPSDLQKKMLLGHRHDDDNSNCPENEI